ncbi:hypothetical protein E3N88_00883 [Mikania micrantha]|uniref:Uncharacterized protein n=1 Tax=Mikania micrantha TaxID=192012 RepID=A0A5N6Q0T6_9ASTR|nr:hypothetical protein E3N88_00883 [Mikania micrantha]
MEKRFLSRFMRLVCDAKGEYEAALEHYVLASITMSTAGQDSDVAAIDGKKSALFGNILNQMGLACVQIDLLDEAAECFEEAKGVLEVEYGPHHPDKLGVYINLAS